MKPSHTAPADEPDDDDDVIDPLPPIVISTDEESVANNVLERLGEEPNLFHRAEQLVRIVTDTQSAKVLLRAPQTPRIVPLSLPNLRELVSRCDFVTDSESLKLVHPPEWCVRAIHARRKWPQLRRLRAVVDAPVLRADGSIASTPGYDEATELLIEPACEFPAMPAKPTKADAVRARDALLEVFCDFPFEKVAHRAACIAAVLTPFARYAFDGPAPLVAIDKNTRGAGGTLLADVVGLIVSGRPMARMVAAKDAEEERKRITSIAISGDPIVLIDNVAGALGTDALDAALTGTHIQDRLLGTNVFAKYPLTVTWFATGNNLEFGADTLRRVMHVRLCSPHEKPEERTGFKHPDLRAWVQSQRPRLVAAALTMLRAYCVAGMPDVELVPWGSFEDWSKLVRGAVVWAGMLDPGRTREELTTSADAEHNVLVDLVAGWREMFGNAGGTVAEALNLLAKSKHDIIDKHEGLRSALSELCPTKNADTLPTARALGAKMKRARGRVVGGLAIDVKGAKGASGVVWVARSVTGGADSGDSSDSASPTASPSKKGLRAERVRESLESRESLTRPSPRMRSWSEQRRASA